MSETTEDLTRRDFVQGAVSGAGLAAAAKNSEKAAVLAQVPKMHDRNLPRLQE